MKQENFESLAQSIVENAGGAENFASISYCSTRLRVFVKDEKSFDIEAIKKLNDVLDVVKSMGGYQIIIGNNANRVYKVISEKYSVNTDEAKTAKTNPFDLFMSTVSAIISPAVPAIIASGLLSALLIVAGYLGLSKESNTYAVFNAVSNVAFYFLPFLLAYTSALRFKTSPVLAIFLAGVMLHPTILTIVTTGTPVTLLGLPMTLVNYSSSLIPIILTIYAMSWVEKLVEKYVPSAVKYVFKPLLIVLVMVPVMLIVTGPLGTWFGTTLGSGLTAIYNVAPWLGILVMGAIAPILLLTGTHLALLPIIITNFQTLGFDNLLLPAFIGVNFTAFAVSAAVFLKTKNKNLKGVSASTAITSFLAGISEPAMYSISLKLKKPLIAVFIGSIVNGIYCAIFGVKVYSFGAPSFFTLPIFIDPNGSNNFYFAIGAIVLTIAVTMAATWMLGFDDTGYGENDK